MESRIDDGQRIYIYTATVSLIARRFNNVQVAVHVIVRCYWSRE